MCGAYDFPHKVGGKCKGEKFIEHYLYYNREFCDQCNCFNEGACDVLCGREDIKHAECFQERLHMYPGEHLPIEVTYHERIR